MQEMASASSDSWLLSLNLDDLRAECKARSGDACVARIPPYIRNLKPHNYDPDILPMGMYNRDFRKKTAMDQLKLEIASAFLEQLHIDQNQWNRFCTEVAHAKGQFSGPGAPDLEHFYQDDGMPSFLTPELELSVLIIDAFFVVAVFVWMIEKLIDETWCLDPRPLIRRILNIFDRKVVACHVGTFILDIFWLYEAQVPLFLLENVWAKAIKASTAENQPRGFSHVITSCLPAAVWNIFEYLYKGDEDVEYSNCEHLLACLHKALCTGTRPLMDSDSPGTRPLMDDDTVTGRVKSYICKVPGVTQFLNFTEQVVSTRRRVKARDLTMAKNGSSPIWRTLPSAACLRKAGISFTGVETNIGDIRFEKTSRFQLTATLYLPKMGFDDRSEKRLLNLCAYEQMNSCNVGDNVTSFVSLMDELIDSEEDVDLLMGGNDPVIVYNALGDNKELAHVFTNLLQNFAYLNDERLCSIRDEIITWYNVRWRRQLIRFLDRFAVAPWLLVSLIAATILLVLTLLQTIYTMWGFYKQY